MGVNRLPVVHIRIVDHAMYERRGVVDVVNHPDVADGSDVPAEAATA
jgi:hypothetical protein